MNPTHAPTIRLSVHERKTLQLIAGRRAAEDARAMNVSIKTV